MGAAAVIAWCLLLTFACSARDAFAQEVEDPCAAGGCEFTIEWSDVQHVDLSAYKVKAGTESGVHPLQWQISLAQPRQFSIPGLKCQEYFVAVYSKHVDGWLTGPSPEISGYPSILNAAGVRVACNELEEPGDTDTPLGPPEYIDRLDL